MKTTVTAISSMIISGIIIVALVMYLGWGFWQGFADTIGRYKFLTLLWK